MIRNLFIYLSFIASICAAQVGDVAPEFELVNQEGKIVKLSDYKGKIVILEWTNPGCPFVKPHYESGAMQKLQSSMSEKGMIWLQINSSAPGREGALANEAAVKRLYDDKKMKSTGYLLDSKGIAGKAYGAKTTPHLFVIDLQGKIAYAGAIDSNPRPQYDPQAQNYVELAVQDLLAGKKVSVPSTKPYGCSVKY